MITQAETLMHANNGLTLMMTLDFTNDNWSDFHPKIGEPDQFRSTFELQCSDERKLITMLRYLDPFQDMSNDIRDEVVFSRLGIPARCTRLMSAAYVGMHCLR